MDDGLGAIAKRLRIQRSARVPTSDRGCRGGRSTAGQARSLCVVGTSICPSRHRKSAPSKRGPRAPLCRDSSLPGYVSSHTEISHHWPAHRWQYRLVDFSVVACCLPLETREMAAPALSGRTAPPRSWGQPCAIDLAAGAPSNQLCRRLGALAPGVGGRRTPEAGAQPRSLRRAFQLQGDRR